MIARGHAKNKIKTHIAVDNFIILSIFNDLANFFDSPIDISAYTTNEDRFLSRVFPGICAKLDNKRLVFSDDTIEGPLE
jgi:hypothetical protein